MDNHPEHKCPECGKGALRIFAGTNLGVKFEQGASPVNNSGVHDLDYPTADKAVGRESEVRWEGYVERDKIKRKVRKEAGESALVRKDVGEGGIESRGMGKGEKKARETFFRKSVGTVAVDKEKALVEARKKPFD